MVCFSSLLLFLLLFFWWLYPSASDGYFVDALRDRHLGQLEFAGSEILFVFFFYSFILFLL